MKDLVEVNLYFCPVSVDAYDVCELDVYRRLNLCWGWSAVRSMCDLVGHPDEIRGLGHVFHVAEGLRFPHPDRTV